MNSTMRICLVSVLLMAALTPPVAVAAGGSPARFTLADLGEHDILVRTVFDQATVHFNLAGGRVIQGAVLELHFAHSAKLAPSLSDITIALNGEPVANFPLTPDNAAKTRLDLPVPEEALRAGENVLLFQFSLRTHTTGCDDFGDPDLWARILADTAFRLERADAPSVPDLSVYPLLFADAETAAGQGSWLVLPDRPTRAELTAAARIAASLGREAGWKSPPLRALSSGELDEDQGKDGNLIVVDTAGRNPLARGVAPGLTVRASPLNPNRLALIVSGGDEESLLASVAMLTATSTRPRLRGTHAGIVPVAPQSRPQKPAVATFAALGHADERVRGIGPHDLYYPIDIPYTWKITDDALINLGFVHAAGLVASEVTVYVNGALSTRVALTNRNARDGRLVVQLSPQQLHPGRNWLHLAVTLHQPREDCRYRYLEETWLEVLPGSTLYLPHAESQPPLDLHYWPSSLAAQSDLGADLFVLPEGASAADMTAMMRFAAKLGTYGESDELRPQAISADEFDPAAWPASHVIALGEPESNILLRRYDAALPQALTRAGAGLQRPLGRELLPGEADGEAGYVEILGAPWSDQAVLVVVNASDAAQMAAVIEALPVKGSAWKLRGNVAVILPDQVAGFAIGGLATATLPPASRSAFAVAVAVLAALSGVGLVLVSRRGSRAAAAPEEQRMRER